MKKNIFDFDEANIFPDILRHWENISDEIDCGKGHFFSSVKEMKKWLKDL